MDLKDKKLENLVVTLPLTDGTMLDCAVAASFDMNGKSYMALQPLAPTGKPDPAMGLMLYGVGEDEEKNPVVLYIEDDNEFREVAARFQQLYNN